MASVYRSRASAIARDASRLRSVPRVGSLRLAVCSALLCTIALAAAATEQGSLLVAAKGGTTAEVQRLLKGGANPNEADADGTSALHWAVHRGAVDSVQALLAAGAAVDAENRYGI